MGQETENNKIVPKVRYGKGIPIFLAKTLYPEQISKNKLDCLLLLQELCNLTCSGEIVTSYDPNFGNKNFGSRKAIVWIRISNEALAFRLGKKDDANTGRALKILEDEGFIIRLEKTYLQEPHPLTYRKIAIVPEKVYGTQQQKEILSVMDQKLLYRCYEGTEEEFLEQQKKLLQKSPPFVFPTTYEDFVKWCVHVGDEEKELWKQIQAQQQAKEKEQKQQEFLDSLSPSARKLVEEGIL